MDSGLSDCADRIERDIWKESNMERRNLMNWKEEGNLKKPNLPQSSKNLQDTPWVSKVLFGDMGKGDEKEELKG